jgi:hypothetical protein
LPRLPARGPSPPAAAPPPTPHPQELLDNPNAQSPAQSDAFMAYTQRLAEYRRKVQAQATKFPPPS